MATDQSKRVIREHYLATTDEAAEFLNKAEEARWDVIAKAINSHKAAPADALTLKKFDLGKFLDKPMSLLGKPYQRMTIEFLSLLIDLSYLYDLHLNQDKKHGSFKTEMQKFQKEIDLKKEDRVHPFWKAGTNFSGVAVCFICCHFGIKRSANNSDPEYFLADYAEANRAIGALCLDMRFDPKRILSEANKINAGISKDKRLGKLELLKSFVSNEVKTFSLDKSASYIADRIKDKVLKEARRIDYKLEDSNAPRKIAQYVRDCRKNPTNLPLSR